MSRFSDDHILQGLRKGGKEEDQCLRALYERERPKFRSFVLQNKGREDDASDLLQESIIVFYEQVKQGKFRGESSISTYLHSIARRKWINRLKRKGVEQRFIDNLKAESEADKKHSPHNLDESYPEIMDEDDKDEKSKLQLAMEKLDPKCREILELKWYQNHTMEEVAEIMGFKNEQNARNKHYKCKNKLRDILGGEL